MNLSSAPGDAIFTHLNQVRMTDGGAPDSRAIASGMDALSHSDLGETAFRRALSFLRRGGSTTRLVKRRNGLGALEVLDLECPDTANVFVGQYSRWNRSWRVQGAEVLSPSVVRSSAWADFIEENIVFQGTQRGFGPAYHQGLCEAKGFCFRDMEARTQLDLGRYALDKEGELTLVQGIQAVIPVEGAMPSDEFAFRRGGLFWAPVGTLVRYYVGGELFGEGVLD